LSALVECIIAALEFSVSESGYLRTRDASASKNEKQSYDKKSKNERKKKQFRWPKATSPSQELEVCGPEGPIRLVG
jgi:hypothetical protein